MSINTGYNTASILQHTRISPERAQEILTAVNKQQQADSATLRAINVADLGETLDADVEFDHALLREAPTLPKGKLTREGSLLLVLATMIETQGEQALKKLSDNLASMQGMLDSRRKHGEKLSAEAESAVQANEQAVAELKDAVSQLSSAEEMLQEKAQGLKQAKAELKQLQEVIDPGSDPDYSANLAAAEQKVNAAQNQFDTASAAVSKAEALSQQKNKVAQSTQDTAYKALKALNDTADSPGYATVGGQMGQLSEKQLNNTAALSLVLAKFIQSVGENSTEGLKNDLAITNAMQEANKKDMLKKADEYSEQQRKAEESNKMTGCMGKIIGGIATAVGVVGLAFGGAGAGLMAVGIGLMVLDPIVEAISGESLTEMMISPIMEHIFMPLMELMSEIIDKMIDYTPLGLLLKELDKLTGLDMTEMVKALAAAAATVAVFVAVAYVAKSAAKTMIDKMPKILTEVVGKAVKEAVEQAGKAVPKMVKKGSKQLSQKIGQMQKGVFKNDVLAQEKWINRLELARNTSIASGAVTQATGNIITGQLQKEAMDTLADFTLSAADMEILKQLVEMIYDAFERKQQLVQQMWGEMRQQLVHQADTGRTVMRNLHASV